MTRISQGEQFPNFSFHTADGQDHNVSDVLHGKTVFWVLRYIGCTVCRLDVQMIKERYDEFKNKNAQVFVVMQSDPEHVQNDLKATDTVLPFSIITDPEQKIYNLLSIEPAESMEAMVGDGMDALKEKAKKAGDYGYSHGDYEGNEQQLPALFIVDENGTAVYVHYAKTIMDMPNIDEVLALL